MYCLSSLPGGREEGTCLMEVSLNFLTLSQSRRETEDASRKNNVLYRAQCCPQGLPTCSIHYAKGGEFILNLCLCALSIYFGCFHCHFHVFIILPVRSVRSVRSALHSSISASVLSRPAKFIFATRKGNAGERIETAPPKSLNKSPIYMAGRQREPSMVTNAAVLTMLDWPRFEELVMKGNYGQEFVSCSSESLT